MISLLTHLTPLVDHYGYALVMGLILLESAGLPVPGESMLLIVSAYAANGHLSLVGVILAAACGAILGDTLGYWVGRRGGPSILRRFLWPGGEARLEKSRQFFSKHGPSAVFFARFFPIMRIFGAVLAGASAMNYWTFSRYNAAGGLVWAVMMGSLGYFFGRNLPLLEAFMHRLGLGLVLGLVIIVMAIWVGRRIARVGPRVSVVGQRLSRWLHLPQLGQRDTAVLTLTGHHTQAPRPKISDLPSAR